PGSVDWLTFAGQVMLGACTSLTVTVNEQLSSEADSQLTVLAPTLKNEPEDGEQLTLPQPPTAPGDGKVTTAPHRSGSFGRTTSAEQVSVQGLITFMAPKAITMPAPESRSKPAASMSRAEEVSAVRNWAGVGGRKAAARRWRPRGAPPPRCRRTG